MKKDVLIVGAGISGITAARILAESGKKVLLIDKKNYIGGACKDEYSSEGVNVHLYGPHIFRTDNKNVYDFITRFSDFYEYQHRVTCYTQGDYYEFPINLKTLQRLYTNEEIKELINHCYNSSANGENFEDVLIARIGHDLYSMFYENYSRKNWIMDPKDISAETASIIPIRNNYDCRYFSEKYQGIPKQGYIKLFNNMINHPNIQIMLNTDYFAYQNNFKFDTLIYTGRLDEFFSKSEGELEYHSVNFVFEKEYKAAQPSPVVNYPNDYDYIRKTDYNLFTNSEASVHIIGKEFPKENGEALYAVPNIKNYKIKQKYDILKSALPSNIKLLGRLATYKNLSMSQSIEQAIEVCKGVK